MAACGARAACERPHSAHRFPRIIEPSSIDPRQIEQLKRRAQAENGLIDGSDITVEYFWAEGKSRPIADLPAELGQRNLDVIVTAGPQPVRALQATATRNPIVFAIHSDPVGDNAVESLARPGGNVTGLSMLNSNLEGKQLEVLKEVLPALKRVLILYDPTMGVSALEDARAGGTGPCTGTSDRTDQQSRPIQWRLHRRGRSRRERPRHNGLALFQFPSKPNWRPAIAFLRSGKRLYSPGTAGCSPTDRAFLTCIGALPVTLPRF